MLSEPQRGKDRKGVALSRAVGALRRGEVAFLKKSSAKNFCRGSPNKGHPKANREAARVRSQKKLEGGAATKVFAELFSKSDLPAPAGAPLSIKICEKPIVYCDIDKVFLDYWEVFCYDIGDRI